MTNCEVMCNVEWKGIQPPSTAHTKFFYIRVYKYIQTSPQKYLEGRDFGRIFRQIKNTTHMFWFLFAVVIVIGCVAAWIAEFFQQMKNSEYEMVRVIYWTFVVIFWVSVLIWLCS